jgi:hypothetical protein
MCKTTLVNEMLTSSGLFSINGHKIKVVRGDPEVGVYFVSATDGKQKVKVAGNLAENTVSKLIGVILALAAGTWKVEIKTQYARSGNMFLKNSRLVESSFTLTVA